MKKKPVAKPAAKKAPAKKPVAAPKKPGRSDDVHAPVRELDTLFNTTPPPGAESGLFHASAATGLAQRTLSTGGGEQAFDYAVPDGAYRVKGSPWTFSFAKGRLIQAVRAEVKHLIPGKLTEISA